MDLPPLPYRPDNNSWSANVLEAFNTISSSIQRAIEVTYLQRPDPLQIQIRRDIISNDIAPLFEALAASSEEEGIPDAWVIGAGGVLVNVLDALDKCKEKSTGR